jgi:hypothetical protein
MHHERIRGPLSKNAQKPCKTGCLQGFWLIIRVFTHRVAFSDGDEGATLSGGYKGIHTLV